MNINATVKMRCPPLRCQSMPMSITARLAVHHI